jgi:hypothetical protein
MLGLPVVAWLDHLLRQAGKPELTFLLAVNVPLVVAASAATIGLVLVSRRPAHPVGWLLLGLGLLVPVAGVAYGYVRYGLVARPGAITARQLPGWNLQRHHRPLAGLRRLRPAAHPYRVAAIAALVVVGQGRGGACGVPGVVGAGPATVVPGRCCITWTQGHAEASTSGRITSPWPVRRTRLPTAGSTALQRPARSVRGERSAPTHAQR